MGVSENDLALSLTERTFVTDKETYKVNLNPEAALEARDALAKEAYQKTFLWLVGFSSWKEFCVFWTEAAFPDIEVDGGNNSITEFEKLMMTLMRANRGFEYATIGLIFGIDRRRVGEYVQQYEKRVGQVGLDLSILDLDLAHDYVSMEDAQKLGLPHSNLL